MRDLALRLTLDQFHDEGLGLVGIFQAVDGGDVGMIQRGEGLGFALEAGNPFRIAGEGRRQHFDRDIAIEFRVPLDTHVVRLGKRASRLGEAS